MGSVVLTSKSQRSPPRLQCMHDLSISSYSISHSRSVKNLFPSHSQVTLEASWASFTENGDAHRLIFSAIPTLTISFFTIVTRADPSRGSKLFNLSSIRKCFLIPPSLLFKVRKLRNSTSCCWSTSFPLFFFFFFSAFCNFEYGSGGLDCL